MTDRPSPKGRGTGLTPPRRFALTHIEPEPETADEGGPGPRTRFLIQRAASIVTENDSPDIPFRFGINAYRGCEHGCAYCLSGETPILMADGTTRPLAELAVGDAIHGTEHVGHYRRFTRTTVLAHWRTVRSGYRVRLADGTELVASADHRFLTERGWKHVATAGKQRPALTTNNHMLGTGRFAAGPERTPEYLRGYLAGMIRGDALLKVFDQEALDRTKAYLAAAGVPASEYVFQPATERRKEVRAIRTSTRSAFERITELIAWPSAPCLGWRKGYLAGLFDAEGCYSDSLRISNSDPRLLLAAEESLAALGFRFTYDVPRTPANRLVQVLRVVGGLREHLRFFHTVDNAIRRKRDIHGLAVKSDAETRVVAVEPLGIELPMYDITTGTGDFIANGIVSHNCYARPTHEYLGLDAGLGFETGIVVKENAPELFRDFLCRDRWVPEPITLSGVTDCYQPCERGFRLTRGLLEVAAEARQPVAIITKNALVLRDLDLLAPMAAEGIAEVNVSITTLDAALARSLEPRTSTPEARLRAVRELSAAGVPVRVMLAPIIPGLNDSEMPAILAAAREAGARGAAWQLVRLPLAVADVFLDWLRREQPDVAAKVEGRLRGARGGKLNDTRFGERMRGDGPIAEQIRALFRLFARRHGLDGGLPPLDCSKFRRPRPSSGQLWLF